MLSKTLGGGIGTQTQRGVVVIKQKISSTTTTAIKSQDLLRREELIQ